MSWKFHLDSDVPVAPVSQEEQPVKPVREEPVNIPDWFSIFLLGLLTGWMMTLMLAGVAGVIYISTR